MNKTNWSQYMLDLFWSKVNYPGNDQDCWEWKTIHNKDGYGYFNVQGTNIGAHRLSWEFYNGIIPNKLLVLHSCDNRPCINPEHLFLGTHKDNTQDMFNKNRQNSPAGQRNAFAILIDIQVVEILNTVKIGECDSVSEIAEYYGVGLDCIYQIFNGTNWKHITKDYDLIDLRKKLIDETCAPYKLTENDVIQIKHRLLNNDSAVDIGNYFGVSQPSILAIKNQETWSHIKAGLTDQQLDQIKNARNRRYKLVENDIREIHKRSLNGESSQLIADSYGIHKTTINRILNGTIWSYVI